jgi:hypothetical protein
MPPAIMLYYYSILYTRACLWRWAWHAHAHAHSQQGQQQTGLGEISMTSAGLVGRAPVSPSSRAGGTLVGIPDGAARACL